MSGPKPTPVLFLDLDQTVRFNTNDEKTFMNDASEVEIYPGVVDRLKEYKSKGWRIVAISNQGGIAKGLVSESQVSRNMAETQRLCANLFDRMAWCPHYPGIDDPEKSQCWCRKPRIGLIVTACVSMAADFDEYYRPYASLFVGDRDEDRKCAENAGIPFMLATDWRMDGRT